MRRLTRSSIIPGPNEPIWQINRLRNSQYLAYHLNNFPENRYMHVSKSSDLGSPQQVISFSSRNYLRPVDEILLARFSNHLLSMVIYAREGVFWQLKPVWEKLGAPLPIVTPRLGDHRIRIPLTIDGRQTAEMTSMKDMIECVRAISPFSSTMQFIIECLLTQTDEQINDSIQLEIDSQIQAPYLSNSEHIMYIGEGTRFNPHRDKVIPVTLPPIFSAILQGDLHLVNAIVNENPLSVLQCDPWGREPIDLARIAEQAEICRFLVPARHKVFSTNDGSHQNYKKFVLDLEFGLHKGYLKWNAIAASQREHARIEQLFSDPIATRTPLQQACVDGDFERVKQEVNQGAAIEAVDPLGFKPLFLAVACNHVDIARWLIEQGASIEKYNYAHPYRGSPVAHYISHEGCLLEKYYHHYQFRGASGMRLINQVNTPEMMKTVLFYHVDSEDALNRLSEFVAADNFEMVEILLFYLRNIDTKVLGMSPFDLVIYNSLAGTLLYYIRNNDTFDFEIDEHENLNPQRMLQLFSRYWDDYVPESPYDKTVPAKVQKILSDHNSKHKRLESARQNRPKIREIYRHDESRVSTTLTLTDNSEIILDTINIATLTDAERKDYFQQCFVLFNHHFMMTENDSLANRISYFREYFSNRHDQAYIDICRHKGKIITFLFYEFLETKTNSIGKFTVFHAQLSCSDALYQRMGLANLAFRAALTAEMHGHKILIYGECIQPGFGFSLFPKFFTGSPCNRLPKDVLPQVVSLTGEKLNPDKTVTTKLKLTPGTFAQNYKLNKYQFFNGDSVAKAAAVAFFLDQETTTQFHHKLKDNGVTTENLADFSHQWLSSSVACKV